MILYLLVCWWYICAQLLSERTASLKVGGERKGRKENAQKGVKGFCSHIATAEREYVIFQLLVGGGKKQKKD